MVADAGLGNTRPETGTEWAAALSARWDATASAWQPSGPEPESPTTWAVTLRIDHFVTD